MKRTFVSTARRLALTTLIPAVATAGPASILPSQNNGLGLYPGSAFRIADGACRDCTVPPQALWYFQGQAIAVPSAPDAKDMPPLVWLGGGLTGHQARLDNGVLTLAGQTTDWQLTPRLPQNRSWFNADSAAFLAGRELSVRADRGPDGKLSVRSFWPADYRLPQTGGAVPLGTGESLQSLVRSENGGARGSYQARILWQKEPGLRWHPGQAVIGLMLNGAQGDDDEAHGGHFAVLTGRTQADGSMKDWLVNNFYNLDSVSEKGIVAAVTPLDSYLAELNSGQSWYRPSYMLVAVLKDGRSAAAYQAAINEVFTQFYRHDRLYDHARSNCAGISIDALRGLGWNIPEQGASGRLKALGAYFYVAASERSLESGRKIYDYLNEEQTRLYPAVAFDAAGNDLLRLAQGGSGRTLSAYEQQLADDLEALVWVRVPQIPSSRTFGQAPVYSFDEYMERTPADRSQWQIVPTPPRPFPEQWKIHAQAEASPAVVPWPVGAILLSPGAVLFWLLRRRRKAQLPR